MADFKIKLIVFATPHPTRVGYKLSIGLKEQVVPDVSSKDVIKPVELGYTNEHVLLKQSAKALIKEIRKRVESDKLLHDEFIKTREVLGIVYFGFSDSRKDETIAALTQLFNDVVEDFKIHKHAKYDFNEGKPQDYVLTYKENYDGPRFTFVLRSPEDYYKACLKIITEMYREKSFEWMKNSNPDCNPGFTLEEVNLIPDKFEKEKLEKLSQLKAYQDSIQESNEYRNNYRRIAEAVEKRDGKLAAYVMGSKFKVEEADKLI